MNETTELIMKQLNSKKVHAETHELGGGDEIDALKLKNIDSFVTKTGDFSGTWNGLEMTSTEPGLSTSFNALKADIATIRNVTKYGVNNDGADVEAALNNLEGGYTYVFPSGTYGVKGFIDNGNGTFSEVGFKLKDNTKYVFLPGAKIKVLTNGCKQYAGININGTQNFELWNAEVEGDRLTHSFASGGTHEFGKGIFIQGNAVGKIYDAYCHDTTGDGIDIICGLGSDITILRGKSYNARRNGMSIESVDRLVVDGFKSDTSNGTNPQVGIDIEPWASSCILNDVTLRNVKCTNNVNGGITVVHVELCASYNIEITNSTMDGLSFSNIAPNTKGKVIVNKPRIKGGGFGIVNNAYPNAVIYDPIIDIDTSKLNLGAIPGAIYIYSTSTADFTIGGMDIVNARIENTLFSTLNPLNVYVPSSGTQAKTIKDMNINIVKNNIGRTIVLANATDFQNVSFGDVPNTKTDLPNGWPLGNGSLVKKHITNRGATADQEYVIYDPPNMVPVNDMTFEVVAPFRVTLRSGVNGSIRKILPFGTNTVYSTTPGAVIKLRYGLDASGVTSFFVDKMIGTWTGV